MRGLPDTLRAALVEVVGPAHVIEDGDVRSGYEVDWTGRFRGRTPAVIRPGSTAETAEVVTLLAGRGLAVVPQGGNTGLVGGGVPLHGEIVLSLRRLATVEPVDALAAQMTVGAGVTLAATEAVAGAAGFAVGVDLAARDSATIGGMIATNAGGLRVIRHGPMRAQVAGIEAVLADGSIVTHLGGLTKDNTGYDLAGLLTGSEGTLGVITRARLRLVRPPAEVAVALLGFQGDTGVESALTLLADLGSRLSGRLEAAELFFADTVALVCAHTGFPPPFTDSRPDVYLLVEVGGPRPPGAELAEVVLGSGVATVDGAVEEHPAGRARLWRYRERITEAIGSCGIPVKMDVGLPVSALPAFARAVRQRIGVRWVGSSCFLFGHAGDGNLHVNVVGVPPEAAAAVEGEVFALAAGFEGSISAEHGVGAAKRDWLHLNRSPAELAAFRAIKSALDPHAMLNPHVLLPAEAGL